MKNYFKVCVPLLAVRNCIAQNCNTNWNKIVVAITNRTTLTKNTFFIESHAVAFKTLCMEYVSHILSSFSGKAYDTRSIEDLSYYKTNQQIRNIHGILSVATTLFVAVGCEINFPLIGKNILMEIVFTICLFILVKQIGLTELHPLQFKI
jgi:hypothetical protein